MLPQGPRSLLHADFPSTTCSVVHSLGVTDAAYHPVVNLGVLHRVKKKPNKQKNAKMQRKVGRALPSSLVHPAAASDFTL